MNETLSFAGWRPGNPDQIIPWKEKFDEEYSDGGQLTLLSKEIYQAEADEDMPAFEYRYIIKAMDLQAFGSDQKTICFRLYMCHVFICSFVNAFHAAGIFAGIGSRTG